MRTVYCVLSCIFLVSIVILLYLQSNRYPFTITPQFESSNPIDFPAPQKENSNKLEIFTTAINQAMGVLPVLQFPTRQLLKSRLEVIDTVTGRQKEMARKMTHLGRTLQAEINRLQHPIDCANSRTAYLHMLPCGLGCQTHRIAFALAYALIKNRTLIIADPPVALTDFMLPITSCTKPSTRNINFSRNFKENADGFPPMLPRRWAQRLERIGHAQPYAWFRGQIIAYILRLRPSEFKTKLLTKLRGLPRPLVGVHVRRGDKIRSDEAKRFEVSSYMHHVDAFFERFTMQRTLFSPRNTNSSEKHLRKIIFLASDDPEVFNETNANYAFEIFGEWRRSSGRWADASSTALEGLLEDIFTLAHSDFTVCTFSSNMCRLVFELKLTLTNERGDRSWDVESLDVRYLTIPGRNAPCIALVTDNRTQTKAGVLAQFQTGQCPPMYWRQVIGTEEPSSEL